MNKKLKMSLVGLLSITIVGLFILGACLDETLCLAQGEYKYVLAFDYRVEYIFKNKRSVYQEGNNVSGVNLPEEDGSLMHNTFIKVHDENSSNNERVIGMEGYVKGSNLVFNISTNYPETQVRITRNDSEIYYEGTANEFTIKNIRDGSYKLEVALLGNSWKEDMFNKARYETYLTSLFRIDNTAPSIAGASVDPNCGYHSGTFSISAFDSNSGIDSVYLKEPSDDKYRSVANNYPISSEGNYSFYAVDKVGNESPIYYYKIDSSNPLIGVYKPNGNVISKYSVNESFMVKGTDELSNVAKAEYKTPSANGFIEYTLGTIIKSTEENGLYEFRIVDNAGNVSNKSVYLDTYKPKGILYEGNQSISSGSFTNAESIKFVGVDEGNRAVTCYMKKEGEEYSVYSPESLITAEGKYSFYVEDLAGNTSTIYEITIDRVAPTLNSSVNFGSATADGFTVNAQKDNSTLFVKEPNKVEYSACENMSYTVTSVSEKGTYYFYARDDIGNQTEEKWIEYQGQYPEAQIIKDEENNTYKAVWDESSYEGFLNGEPYESGTIIDTEGDYKFEIKNKIGNVKSYDFTIGHKYNLLRTVKPTCTQEGYTEYQCISCGQTFKTNKVPIIEHNYVERITKATCKAKGKKERVCTMCGKSEIIEEYPMLEHEFEEIVIKPTCETKGCHRHKCKNCDTYYDTEVVEAFGHNYETTLIKEATCTEDGLRHFKCLTCGKEFDQVIKAKGHNYRIDSEVKVDGKTIRTYVCDECGDSYTMELGDQHSEVVTYIDELFLKYEPFMWWILLGTSGIWSIFIGVMLVLAHKDEDKIKFKKMLINYVIGLVVIAMLVVACPYLIKGIASIIN